MGKAGDQNTAAQGINGHDLQKLQEQLPIASARKQLISLVKAHRTLVLVGETGSGKSTQLPQYLYKAGLAEVRSVNTCQATHAWLCYHAEGLVWLQQGKGHSCDTAPASGSNCHCTAGGAGDGGPTRCRGLCSCRTINSYGHALLVLHVACTLSSLSTCTGEESRQTLTYAHFWHT